MSQVFKIWKNGLNIIVGAKRSHFLLASHERERERKKIKTSLFNPRSSVGWNSSGHEQKFIYSTKATSGYQKHRILSRIQAMSSGNQRLRV